jgi:hypothetical protein
MSKKPWLRCTSNRKSYVLASLQRNLFEVDFNLAHLPGVGRKKRGLPRALRCSRVAAVCNLRIAGTSQCVPKASRWNLCRPGCGRIFPRRHPLPVHFSPIFLPRQTAWPSPIFVSVSNRSAPKGLRLIASLARDDGGDGTEAQFLIENHEPDSASIPKLKIED